MLNDETMPETLSADRWAGDDLHQRDRDDSALLSLAGLDDHRRVRPQQRGARQQVPAAQQEAKRAADLARNAIGYTTIHVGRYLNGYENVARARTRPAPGWEQWHSLIKPRRYYGYTLSVNGGTVDYPNAPENYLTTVLTESAVEMVERFGPQSQALLPPVRPPRPAHLRRRGERRRLPRRRDPGPPGRGRLRRRAAAAAPLLQRGRRDRQALVHPDDCRRSTPDQIDNIERRYRCALGSLREVDRSIAAIDEALAAIGEEEETIVIFTLGQRLLLRRAPDPELEELRLRGGGRLPLLIRAPRRATSRERPPRRGQRAGRQHRHRADDPRLRGRRRLQEARWPPLPVDGRALADAAAAPEEGELSRRPRRSLVELDRDGGASRSRTACSGICAYQGVQVPGLSLRRAHRGARSDDSGSAARSTSASSTT